MEQNICFSELDDFIFCPASLYFHTFYRDLEDQTYKTTDQTLGTMAHQAIDEGRYSNRQDVLQAISVYSEQYGIGGKIDLFKQAESHLIERKRSIKRIYDGYVFQLYGQCYALREMGYEVQKISLYSMLDLKTYAIPLPEENETYRQRFEQLISNMKTFTLEHFHQDNPLKCRRCIYRAACCFAASED